MEYSNTYARIDLDAIGENFRAIREKAGAAVMAVVKADAYGHGAVPVAKMLEGQCAFFGVSSVAEALELVRAGITTPILLLGHTLPELFPVVVENGLRSGIFTEEDAQALSAEAVRQGKIVPIHFVVDTGMSRIGFQATRESAEACVRIAQLPGLKAEGLFSHFATADEEDLTRTRQQAETFAAFDAMLRDMGLEIPLRHLDNSAGIMRFGCHCEMVRAGIVLYGLYPSGEVDPALLKLRPAMSWHAKVSHVKWLEPGREISYGGTFVTQKPTRVATVSVGYADGYRRNLSGRFYVLIRGQRAPILGRVCMDQLMVDVTGIPGVETGDEVTLMGAQGGQVITAEALAEAAGSFNYEQICDLSRRVTRVFVKDGKEIAGVNYLLDRVTDFR